MDGLGDATAGPVVEREILGAEHQSLRSIIEMGSRRNNCQATVPMPKKKTINGIGRVCNARTFQSKMFISLPCGSMKLMLNELRSATPLPPPVIQAPMMAPGDSDEMRRIGPEQVQAGD